MYFYFILYNERKNYQKKGNVKSTYTLCEHPQTSPPDLFTLQMVAIGYSYQL